MAGFTKTNGTTQPVFHMDTGNGNIGGTANIAATGSVNFQGPKLDFFSVVANGSLTTSGNVNGYINNIIQAIQQTATVAMYQVDGVTLSFATYPTGAFANATTNTSAATFLAAANIAFTGYQLDSCTSIGFKLAAS